MNRSAMMSRILLLEQIAVEAKARAGVVRDQLAQDARAEFAEQGTAPTWRLPDIGSMTLPVSQQKIYVEDESKLVEWLKRGTYGWNEAVETVERVKPAYLSDLLNIDAQVVDGVVCDGEGEVIPGLAVRAGGEPMPLTFRPTYDAKKVAAVGAQALVDELEDKLGGPVVIAEANRGPQA